MARRGHARPAPRGLDEPRPGAVGSDLGLTLEVGERHRREAGRARSEPQDGGTDEALGGVAAVDNAAVLHFDPRLEPVGEAEAVGEPQVVDVVEDVGLRRVLVAHAHFERELGHPLNGFGRDPGDRRDRGGDAHGSTLRPSRARS